MKLILLASVAAIASAQASAVSFGIHKQSPEWIKAVEACVCMPITCLGGTDKAAVLACSNCLEKEACHVESVTTECVQACNDANNTLESRLGCLYQQNNGKGCAYTGPSGQGSALCQRWGIESMGRAPGNGRKLLAHDKQCIRVLGPATSS